jgi:hypothetical protein
LNVQHVPIGGEGTVCIVHSESVAGRDRGRMGQLVVLSVVCESREGLGRRLRGGAGPKRGTERFRTGDGSGSNGGGDKWYDCGEDRADEEEHGHESIEEAIHLVCCLTLESKGG